MLYKKDLVIHQFYANGMKESTRKASNLNKMCHQIALHLESHNKVRDKEQAPDHPQVSFLKIGVETSQIVLSPVWCSKLRLTTGVT
ncbi:hypothetical protein TNCV_4399171 [Trichonephila clavipes]|nr:hypothetical protein TNCV_4399171 [Trichonephila clavipes]